LVRSCVSSKKEGLLGFTAEVPGILIVKKRTGSGTPHERLQGFVITDYTNEYAVAYARAHIVRKTGVQGQVDLTKYAARMGLIDLDLWN